MKILVAGGAGYVGSHMVKLLMRSGHQVTVFDNLSRGHKGAIGVAPLVTGDVLNGDELREAISTEAFDVVMHFAALCYVGESVAKPRAYYRNNVVGSLNLIDALVDAGIRNIVFSSSCS